MTGLVIIGAIFAIAGLGLLITALRGDRERPRTVAMLIGGMMATAFGILMAGFAIAYSHADPLDLNTSEAR